MLLNNKSLWGKEIKVDGPQKIHQLILNKSPKFQVNITTKLFGNIQINLSTISTSSLFCIVLTMVWFITKKNKCQQLSGDTHIGTGEFEHEDTKVSLNQMENGLKAPKQDYQYTLVEMIKIDMDRLNQTPCKLSCGLVATGVRSQSPTRVQNLHSLNIEARGSLPFPPSFFFKSNSKWESFGNKKWHALLIPIKSIK